jgi:hypothetical protein
MWVYILMKYGNAIRTILERNRTYGFEIKYGNTINPIMVEVVSHKPTIANRSH